MSTTLSPKSAAESATLPKTMRAIVKEKAAPGLVLREVPVPQIGPNDLLIKIEATSICGTDLHIYNWNDWAQNRIKPPLVIGHECCGRVVAVGSARSVEDACPDSDRDPGPGSVTSSSRIATIGPQGRSE